MIKLKDTLPEKFLDVAKEKDAWVDLESPEIKRKAVEDIPLRQNIYDLIDNTYKSSAKSPHFNIKSYRDVLNGKYDYWEAINLDNYPDADAVLFGKKTKYGIKICGIGHDGQPISKRSLLDFHINLLKKPGYYAECSPPISDIFIHKGVKINGLDVVQSIFGDKVTQTFNDNSYIRKFSSHDVTVRKYLFGNPNV
jgi:hypothetical protein